jgi:tetratricopeptide (TPR) repeat protein
MRISPTACQANKRSFSQQVERKNGRRRGGVRTSFRLSVALTGVFALCSMLASPLPAQEDKSSFDSIAKSAAAARDANDSGYATLLYQQALKIDPAWAEGWWNLGVLLYGNDKFVPARDAFTHLISLSPDAAPAIALRGLCEYEIGDYGQSLADLRRGIAMGAAADPRNGSILRFHEAVLLAHSGDFEGAMSRYAFFANGVEAAPEILEGVGMAGLRVSSLPKEIANDPAKQAFYTAAGAAGLAYMAGNTDHAAEAFADLFKRYPDAANLHYFYGFLLFSLELDKAIAELQREIQLFPSNAQAEALLGWAYIMQGDYAQALQHGKHAAAEDPQLTSAQLVMGRSLIETGDIKGGLEHLNEVIRREPNNPEAHLALVKAYSLSGRKQEAQRERQLCLRLYGIGGTAIAKP